MKRIFLLGYPIAHSLSPAMHNAALRAMGLDWQYALWEIQRDGLPDAVAQLRDDTCIGANVTIPHKEAVVEWLDELGASACDVRAVNTIVKRDGRLIGENTDIAGFLQALGDVPFDPRDAHTVILGAGGAARGIAFALGQAKAASLVILNRTRARAEALAEELRLRFPRLQVSIEPDAEWPGADLVVNSLPVSASFDLSSLRLSIQAVAFDLIYHLAQTPFMRQAERAGARAVNGLGMLVYQGAASLRLWSGQQPPTQIMFDAARCRVMMP